MSLLVTVNDGAWDKVRRNFARLGGPLLGPGSGPTFVGLTITGLNASEFVMTDASKGLVSLAVPILVNKGGTGLVTITNHGLMVGSGTGAVTALAEASNGQLPIGSTGFDPVLATLTEGAGIDITNAAGSITIATTITQYTDELAQDAVGGILDNGTVGSIVFTYNDGDGVISAVTQDGEIDHDSLLNFASNEHFVQTDITNVSSALTTGLLKVTTTTGALSVVTDSSANWDTAYSHSGLTSGNPHNVTPTELGLVIGTNVQAWDAQLDDIAALALADGNIIVGNGTNWVAENGATARTSLGLGTTDSPQFTAIELGAAADTTITRVSAGVIAVEGVTVMMVGGAPTAHVHNGDTLQCDGINSDGGAFSFNTTAAVTFNQPVSLGTGELTCGSINKAANTLTLEIGGVAKVNILDTYVATEVDTYIRSGNLLAGVDDATVGVITCYGGATGTYGGRLYLYTNADADATIDSYYIRVAEDDLHIGDSLNGNIISVIGTGGAVNINKSVTLAASCDFTMAGHIIFNTNNSYIGFADPRITFNDTDNQIEVTGHIVGSNSLFLTEKASAGADVVGLGQIWVKNTTPNELWFTDDAGTDVQLGHRFVDRGDPAAADFLIAALTGDGTWYDLDLSSIVPAGAVAVVYQIQLQDDAVGTSIKLRKNGNSNQVNISRIRTMVVDVTNYADLITACDSNRVIEYALNAGATVCNIIIKGWFV